MDRPVFKVVIFSECVVLISGIGMAPPSGMGGSETSEYSKVRLQFYQQEQKLSDGDCCLMDYGISLRSPFSF